MASSEEAVKNESTAAQTNTTETSKPSQPGTAPTHTATSSKVGESVN